MKRRGKTYRNWCDPILHRQTHEETLDDGTCLEVQTRLSRTGATQLFVGVYRADGTVLCERAYAQRAGEQLTGSTVGLFLRWRIASMERRPALATPLQ